ncbi:metallopeptidase [Staphylococcus felis]|uniref:Metallopeptidase n=1 Tax=Staphylococcus felis TaxID=46127 RepID=A0AAX1RV29_9STAP|nr:DUF2268 domain-containing putative Zn-dependent protease [Staphylococcus felis]REH75615.1 metallopeptidase [Staphylococcus felis]REH81263.1 metallopeptidase [Staphylococcus felis]REH84321.1 metallopeptidase [Staphylococcus felis]REH92388.1 metallopeptidase [Staphylococcus felis]REH99884.1 metallopeptidase [Staphylococcus felis]
MYNIKIIRSDKVYLDLLEQEYDNKSQYFKDNLLTYFKEKFEVQKIPYDSDSFGFDVLKFLNQSHVSPEEFNSKHISEVKRLDDDFWSNCRKYIENAIKQFELNGIQPLIDKYIFTVLLGDSEKPTMYLNNNYGGDGGVPGYVFLSIVPNTYTLDRVKSAIAHEMNHNIRYQYLKWDGGSLAELIISEGLAENFVKKMYGNQYLGPWVTTIDWKKQQNEIRKKIKENIDIDNMFEAMPYLYGDEITKLFGGVPVGLPHAAGYTCGYYLIKYYLEKTQCTIEEATIKSSDEILREVNDFWSTNIV